MIGAILPLFLFSRPSRPVTELPAWSNRGGSARIAENTSQTTAPAWPTWPAAPATAAAGSQTPPAPAILLPQPPQVGDTRPSALTEPSWRSSVAPPPAATPSLPPSSYINPPVISMNPPDNRSGYRGYERPADPRTLQADNRNNPAAQYRNSDPRYDDRGYPIDNSSVRRDVPPGQFSARPSLQQSQQRLSGRCRSGQSAHAVGRPGPNIELS